MGNHHYTQIKEHKTNHLERNQTQSGIREKQKIDKWVIRITSELSKRKQSTLKEAKRFGRVNWRGPRTLREEIREDGVWLGRGTPDFGKIKEDGEKGENEKDEIFEELSENRRGFDIIQRTRNRSVCQWIFSINFERSLKTIAN